MNVVFYDFYPLNEKQGVPFLGDRDNFWDWLAGTRMLDAPIL